MLDEAILATINQHVAAATLYDTANPAIEAANATNAVPEITFRTRVREAGLFRMALSAKGANPNLPMQSKI